MAFTRLSKLQALPMPMSMASMGFTRTPSYEPLRMLILMTMLTPVSMHMPIPSHGMHRALQVTNLCLYAYGYVYDWGLPSDSAGLPSYEPMVVSTPVSVVSHKIHQLIWRAL